MPTKHMHRKTQQHASVAAILSFLLLLFTSATWAKDTITWMEVNMPPYMIQTGPYRDMGYGNVVQGLLQANLPQYTHERLSTNVVRHFDMFRQGKKVCSIGLYRTPERESFLHFSIPSMLTMPPVLIIRADRLHDFGGKNGCSLVELLQDEKFRLGLSRDRSYGRMLDKELGKFADRTNTIRFAGQELGENYFKMLLLDRIDGLLGLPDEAIFRAEQMGIRDQITTVMLTENQQNYEGWYCAIACPKNQWGKHVIEQINDVLLKIRPTPPYRQAYERWLDDNSRTRYRTVYDKIFLKTSP